MKFLVMVKATETSEAGGLPDPEMLSKMGAFNDELKAAGVLREADGLKPSAKGARLVFDGDKRTVIDGPFAETKELVAGFWIWECASMEEAMGWLKRCPHPHPGDDRAVVELRPTYTAEDFAHILEQLQA